MSFHAFSISSEKNLFLTPSMSEFSSFQSEWLYMEVIFQNKKKKSCVCFAQKHMYEYKKKKISHIKSLFVERLCVYVDKVLLS